MKRPIIDTIEMNKGRAILLISGLRIYGERLHNASIHGRITIIEMNNSEYREKFFRFTANILLPP
jgi:hypothetical protein